MGNDKAARQPHKKPDIEITHADMQDACLRKELLNPVEKPSRQKQIGNVEEARERGSEHAFPLPPVAKNQECPRRYENEALLTQACCPYEEISNDP